MSHQDKDRLTVSSPQHQALKQSLDWLILMKEELGNDWLRPTLFRFGASSLLSDIERQLEHHVTGRYAALRAD